MAFPTSIRNTSSSFSRVNTFVLIALLLVCSISYCTSASVYSEGLPSVSTSDAHEELDSDVYSSGKCFYYEATQFYSFFYSQSNQLNLIYNYLDAEERFIPFEKHLMDLLRSVLLHSKNIGNRFDEYHTDRKRYSPQSFHAMRG